MWGRSKSIPEQPIGDIIEFKVESSEVAKTLVRQIQMQQSVSSVEILQQKTLRVTFLQFH